MNVVRFALTLAVTCYTLTLASASTGNGSRLPVTSGFLENVGQVRYSDGRPANHVLASRVLGERSVLAHRSGWHLVQYRATDAVSDDGAPMEDVARVDIDFVGGTAQSVVYTDVADYPTYVGGHRDVGTSRPVTVAGTMTLTNVWPNIDVKMYARPDGWKYEFVVRPGGDPNNVRLRVHGATPQLDHDGRLVLGAPLGNIIDEAPISFTVNALGQRKVMNSNYVIHGSEIFFSLGGHVGTSETLVIDPEQLWGTYLGGNGVQTQKTGLALDSLGNTLVVSGSRVAGLPTTFGVVQRLIKSDFDGIVFKFSPEGKIIWGTYYGATLAEEFSAVGVNSDGDVIVAGSTRSDESDLVLGFSPIGDDTAALYDVLVVRLSSEGRFIDGFRIGGQRNDYATALAVKGRALAITGYATSSRFGQSAGVRSHNIVRNPPLLTFNEDAWTAFLVPTAGGSTYNSRWYTWIGGDNEDYGNGVAFDKDTNVIVVGSAKSPTDMGMTDDNVMGGVGDGFLVKYAKATGNILYATYIGGTNREDVTDVAANDDGYVIVGRTLSTDIITRNAHQAVKGPTHGDAYIASYTNTNVLKWATYWGGDGDEWAKAVCVTKNGDVWVGGFAHWTNQGMDRTSDAFQATNNTLEYWGPDGFFSRFDKNGVMLYNSFIGGAHDPGLPPPGPSSPPDPNADFGYDEITDLVMDGEKTIVIGCHAQTRRMPVKNEVIRGDILAEGTPLPSIPFVTMFSDCKDTTYTIATAGPPVICDNGTLQLVAPQGFSKYVWSTGGTSRSITVSQPGSYNVMLVDPDGCRYRDTIVVTANPKPTVEIGANVTICRDSSHRFTPVVNGGTQPYRYKWNRIESGPEFIDNDTIPSASVNPGSTSRYTLTVTDAAGCTASDTATVAILDIRPTVAPGSVDFGSLDACSSSTETTLTITNPLSIPINVSGFVSNWAIVSLVTPISPPVQIAAGGTASFTVRATPTTAGVTNGTFTLQGSPCNWTVSVPFTVEKQQLVASILPSAVTFPSMASCDLTASDTTLVVRNSGTDALVLQAPTLSTPEFSASSAGYPRTVNPGDTAHVKVAFFPPGVGVYTGAITIAYTSGSCDATLKADLFGSVEEVRVTIEDTTIDVGTLSGCDDNVRSSFIIRNTGGVDITVTIAGDGLTTIDGPTSRTVPAGMTTSVDVIVTPDQAGAFASTVTVETQPCAQLRTVRITGSKANASLNVTSTATFGEVSSCAGTGSSTFPITLGAVGGDFTIRSVVVPPGVTFPLAAGTTIADNATVSVTATWSPTADGELNDSIVITSDPCDVRRVIRLTGSATTPALSASTPVVALGTVVGTATGQVIFFNTGTDTLSVTITAVTPDLTITIPAQTNLNEVLPGASIRVDYEVACNGRTEINDTILARVTSPCRLDAITALTGVCGSAPTASAEIVIDTAIVRVGDQFSVPLRIVSSQGLNTTNARAWTATVAYNPAVLVGRAPTTDCWTAGTSGPCEITVTGTRGADTTGVLAQLNFTAVLGNDSASALQLVNFAFTDATTTVVGQRDGYVLIEDLCQEGGTRLLFTDADSRIRLNPTPTSTTLTMSGSRLTVSPLSWRIYNLTGKLVAEGTVLPEADGSLNVDIDVSTFGSGTHTIDIQHIDGPIRSLFLVTR